MAVARIRHTMLHKIANYVLLLNFVNTVFFHELYLPSSFKISPYDQQDPKSAEVDSLMDLLLNLWLEYSGGSPGKGFQEKPDQISFEKDFLPSGECSIFSRNRLKNPPLRGHLTFSLSDRHGETISPPPKPVPASY